MDDGALIRTKRLEIVRNIYDELLKTANYRECLEIKKYAMLSESVRRRKAFMEAASWIAGINIISDLIGFVQAVAAWDPCSCSMAAGPTILPS